MNKKKFIAGATLAAFGTTMVPVVAFAADAKVTSIDVKPDSAANGKLVVTVKLNAPAGEDYVASVAVEGADIGNDQEITTSVKGITAIGVPVAKGETVGSVTLAAADVPAGTTFAVDGVTDKVTTDDVAAVSTTASRDTSDIYNDGDEVVLADSKDKAKFAVQLRNAKGNDIQAVTEVYFWAENKDGSVADALVFSKGTAVGGGHVYKANTDSNGRLEFDITSSAAQNLVIKAAVGGTTDKDNDKDAVDDLKPYVLGSANVEFEAVTSSVGQIAPTFSKASTGKYEGLDLYTIDARGYDKLDVTAVIKNKNGQTLANQKVYISADKYGLELSKEEAVTDSQGRVKFSVSAFKTQSKPYIVTISAGDYEYEFAVKTAAGDPVSITTESAPEYVMAKDKEVTFEVAARDVFGNKVKELSKEVDGQTRNTFATDECEAVMGTKEIRLQPTQFADGSYVNADGNFEFTFTPNKEGVYEVTIRLGNGKAVKETVEVKEQGKIAKMELKYDEEQIVLGGVSDTPKLIKFDADGVAAEYYHNFPISNLSIDGKGVELFDKKTGVIHVNDDDKYAGQVLTVTAVDKRDGVVATTELKIVGELEGLAFGTDKIQVGKETAVPFSVVDSEGKKVALGSNITIDSVNAVVVEKPEGAKVSVYVSKENDLKDKGVANLVVHSDKEGQVKVLVTVDAHGFNTTNNADTEQTFTGYATIDVVDGPVSANDMVTMWIGSTDYMVGGETQKMDVAPFIKDSRTFVPVRTLGEATGAKVEYNDETQVITIAKGDLTVTMTVGSNVITTSKGDTITADVAPFVKEGRAVLPLRAAAEAIGCDVEAIFAADGSTAGVVFTAK